MRRCLVAVCCFLSLCLMAAPSIVDVTARQRYPWNGLVDVSYTVVGSTNGIDRAYGHLEAVDEKTGKVYAATTFVQPLDMTEGTHAAIWDMAADHAVVSESMSFRVSVRTPPLYRVIDVTEGAAANVYPVLELDEAPADGWSDEYKINRIVLRRIDGTNGVYYAGIFEITESQWDKVMGGTSASTKPNGSVSYNTIRGDAGTYDWPGFNTVDPTSFMGRLRQKTGLATLDLPSEEEWEYAARAGVTTTWLCGDSETGLDDYAWYSANSDGGTHAVGTRRANAWGLYDVHGNVWEWCLNRYSSGSGFRVLRGGAYSYGASICAFAYRSNHDPSYGWNYYGFRLFCRPGSN